MLAPLASGPRRTHPAHPGDGQPRAVGLLPRGRPGLDPRPQEAARGGAGGNEEADPAVPNGAGGKKDIFLHDFEKRASDCEFDSSKKLI